MKIELRLSISRPSNGGISLRIEDKLSGIKFIDAEISLEEFAEAITGLSSRPMMAEVRGLNYIGKKKVWESRSIECTINTYDRNILTQWLKENANEDGWITDTYLGSQSSIKTEKDKTILNYVVYKYVEAENT
jgi:hypothetical protein